MRAQNLLRSFTHGLLALALAAGVHAQTADPNTERGITPGKAYSAGEPDTVNLFNGNLNLTIPVGQTYHAGGTLSYGLNLYYGSNGWEHGQRNVDVYMTGDCSGPLDPYPVPCAGAPYTYHYAWSFPSRRSNAGLGWILSLGSLYHKDNGCPPTGPCNFVAYESPDGALHGINYWTLHNANPNETPYPSATTATVFYSRDGTYLRYRTDNPAGMQLEFPDGTIELFDSRTGLLTKKYDPFGNWLQVSYNDVNNPYCDVNSPHCASTWHLQDSQGRNHYVYFRPVASYYETNSPVAPGQTQQSALVAHEAVAEVKLQTFGGATSSYYFHYEGEGTGAWPEITRQKIGGGAVLDPGLTCTTPTTLLTSVVMPDSQQSTYTMSYETAPGCAGAEVFNSGNLLTLFLPTGGRIQWTYKAYSFNNPGISLDWNLSARGVASRTIYDASTKPISLTTYDQSLNYEAGIPAPESQTTVTVSSGDGTETLSKSIHYFSTCVNTYRGGGCSYPTGEYGLPFTRVPKSYNPDSTGTRFLSTVELSRDATGQFTVPARKTYLRYEADDVLSSSKVLDKGRRVASRRTVYENGTVADDDSSVFDGLGHYRQQATGGTFGRADTRTTFTNYNPNAGTFSLVNGVVTGFTMVGLNQPWVLGTYTHSTVTETLPGASSSTTALTQYCFDTTNGFLKRKRLFRLSASGVNPSSYPYSTDDVLAVFTHSNGNVIREQYLGGDNGPAPSTTDTCNSSISSEAYRIDHTYQYGSVATSQYYDESGAAFSFKNLDTSIDPNTGLVSTVRDRGDVFGYSLGTDYTYDALGRLTDVKPSSNTLGGAWTHFDYTMNPPRVDAYNYPHGASSGALAHSATQFDVLGRVWRESQTMADGTTSIRETLYNGAGWKASQSEAEVTPTHRTVFAYDSFGRPTTVTAPDGSAVTMSYNGASSMTKTVGVRTGGDATNFYLSNATTTETYDRQGRLWQVTDPANTVTEYTYDIGGRLSKVCMNKSGSTCGQSRYFNYDNRGFLTSDTQPETGQTGDATTSYLSYDARGHATRRLTGPANGTFDLSYQFDRAERLMQISYTGSGRPLKVFTFGTDNDVAHNDYRNGRITRTVRYNWMNSVNYGVQVAEDYTYGGKDGRISARRTTDYECLISGSQPCTIFPAGTLTKIFNQSFTYDDLGQTVSLGYPSCANTGCVGVVPAAPTVTNGYTNGFLTSVNWTGSPRASTISYWPNGLVKQVAHGNYVTDTQALDPDGMERPAGISTSGAADASQCTAPTIAANPQSATITNTSYAHLTVTATADSNTSAHPVTYQWYNDAGVMTGQTGTAIDVNTPGTYWAGVSNGCGGTVTSAAAVVAVCQPPGVSTQPQSVTITQGNTATLTVGATGTSPHYQWYVMVSAYSIPVGDDSPTLKVAPTSTKSYWVQIINDCGLAGSYNVNVTVIAPPSAPVLTATANGSYSVNLAWSAPSSTGSGLDHYEIQRLYNGGAFGTYYSSIAPNVTSIPDNGVSPLTSYLYRIRAVDTSGVASPWSNADLATTLTFAYDPVVSRGTPVSGTIISQLRQAIDSVRRTANLTPTWTNYSAPTGPVYGAAVMEMRAALDDARSLLGLAQIAYAVPTESAGDPIRASDINDLRGGIK